MTISNGLNTTLNIINSAASILGNDKVSGAARMGTKAAILGSNLNERAGMVGGAITGLSQQNTILSRVFVSESILDEPILPNFMRSTHEWYTAQIIAALQLSQMVDSHRTVSDVMSIVQTGHNARKQDLNANLWARRAGQESFLSNYVGEVAVEAFGSNQVSPRGGSDSSTGNDDRSHTNVSVRSVNTSENRIGPMGELYEIKLTNPNNDKASVTVPVFIQMQPSIVPADIAPRFIDMNVSPTLWQRWTQQRAGELSFTKDFLFQRDLIKRQKTILKDPKKAEAFSNFLKTVAKKDTYALGDASDNLGARHSSNLANSVMIFSEDDVMQAKADSGVDLHNVRDRQRYFRDTYTMIIAVVDPLHQRVTVYFNGVDGELNCSYSDFRPKDSKFDPKDFMGALQAFSTNNISRLR